MDKQDTNWLLTLADNINTYLKHRKEQQPQSGNFQRWIDPKLIILVDLYSAYPEPLPQSKFVSEMHCRNTISKTVNYLYDNKFIKIEKVANEPGKPNYLHLSDSGKEFIDYINP